ncbi:MAG: hypothetical protein KKF46_01685, partial [Nanoarchaeota archaeon]|nr:hypothetical protein [Nanoarchaeota archaeon]MBU1598112.1 hypothetical protein [Nanoarchaeota archaeon]
GALVASFIGVFSTGIIMHSKGRAVPYNNIVEQDFAVPRKIQIYCRDMNLDGIPETMLKYDGKPYYLKLNDQGELVIAPYQLD